MVNPSRGGLQAEIPSGNEFAAMLRAGQESHPNVPLRSGGRQILILGAALVLAGLGWGFFVPMTPYPRLALGAHIQFVTNGMLAMVLGIVLLKLPHRVGRKSIWVMVLAAWLIWPMALSEVGSAWWGTNQMLPLAAAQAGARGAAAWQEGLVKITHIAAGLALVAAWTLLVIGLARRPAAAK
jgi:hydroxylaminobenzene mutase